MLHFFWKKLFGKTSAISFSLDRSNSTYLEQRKIQRNTEHSLMTKHSIITTDSFTNCSTAKCLVTQTSAKILFKINDTNIGCADVFLGPKIPQLWKNSNKALKLSLTVREIVLYLVSLQNSLKPIMEQKEIERIFINIMENEPNISAGMAAIKTLLSLLKHDTSGTIQELHCTFRNAIETMKKSKYPVTAVASGCELFMRFITLAALDNKNFQECKQLMLNRGQLFFKKLNSARDKVAKLASAFIVDGAKILTHSKSRVVLQAMKEATNLNKRFEVFVTTSAPDNSGKDMCKELEKLGVPCTVILDSAVGYIMESVDMIMVGAEAVVESGGIINKVGSYTIALCAREASKPFYVLTESFKFVRLYPLNQRDLPVEFKYTCAYKDKDLSKADPLVDYTPPVYITLLFTDLGILTPSAVSDELIKLYL